MPFSLMKFFKLRQEKEDTMADMDAVTSNIGEIETTSYRQLETTDTPPPAVPAVVDAGLHNTNTGDQSSNYVPIRRSSTKKRTVPSILKEGVFKTENNAKNETKDENSQQAPGTDETEDNSQTTLKSNKTEDSSLKSPETNETDDNSLKPSDTNKTDSNSQKTPDENKTEDKLQKTSDNDNRQKENHKDNEGKVQKSKIPKSVSFSKNLVHDSSAGDNRRRVIRRSSTRTRTIPTILKTDFLKGEQNEEQEGARKKFYFGFEDKKEDPKLS